MNHLFFLSCSEIYTNFPYTIEAEDCDGAGDPWSSIYGTRIKDDY